MVIFIYKRKGERSSLDNYRSIGVIHAIATVYKKIIIDNISQIMEDKLLEC